MEKTMRRRMPAAALALLLVAGTAGAANSYLGKEAPEFEASEWIGRPEKTSVADHRGEVLLLEFFATW
jgi:hypothetical protein